MSFQDLLQGRMGLSRLGCCSFAYSFAVIRGVSVTPATSLCCEEPLKQTSSVDCAGDGCTCFCYNPQGVLQAKLQEVSLEKYNKNLERSSLWTDPIRAVSLLLWSNATETSIRSYFSVGKTGRRDATAHQA